MNDDDFSKWIVDTTLKEDRHKGTLYTAYDMCHKLNELYEENEQLRKYNGQLKKRLERINGGYGHLTYRRGLTANEWLIESQERELEKKNEQISDLKEENDKLKKQVEDCRDYNAILYKNCIQKDKRWLKRIKRVEDELEEYIKENARLREMYNDD